MRVRPLSVLTVLLFVAACERQPPLDQLLQNAGRNTSSGVVDIEVRVPGADPHREVVEYGVGRGQVWMRMPGLYELTATDSALAVTAEPRTSFILKRAAAGDLQKSVDDAFNRQGSPLVPVPLLLRGAKTPDERLQAFRLKLLEPLEVVSRTRAGTADLVVLRATNGSVTARFEKEKLTRINATVAAGAGHPPIDAVIEFRDAPVTPPDEPSGLREVRSLGELTGVERATGTAELSLTSSGGGAVSLDSFRGSVVVLEFFATWCAPCRVTLPEAAALAEWSRTANLPVKVFLVNTEETRSAAEVGEYLRSAGIREEPLLDPDSKVHRRFGGGLPLTLIIDQEGNVVETYAGFSRDLQSRVRERVTELAERRR